MRPACTPRVFSLSTVRHFRYAGLPRRSQDRLFDGVAARRRMPSRSYQSAYRDRLGGEALFELNYTTTRSSSRAPHSSAARACPCTRPAPLRELFPNLGSRDPSVLRATPRRGPPQRRDRRGVRGAARGAAPGLHARRRGVASDPPAPRRAEPAWGAAEAPCSGPRGQRSAAPATAKRPSTACTGKRRPPGTSPSLRGRRRRGRPARGGEPEPAPHLPLPAARRAGAAGRTRSPRLAPLRRPRAPVDLVPGARLRLPRRAARRSSPPAGS